MFRHCRHVQLFHKPHISRTFQKENEATSVLRNCELWIHRISVYMDLSLSSARTEGCTALLENFRVRLFLVLQKLYFTTYPWK